MFRESHRLLAFATTSHRVRARPLSASRTIPTGPRARSVIFRETICVLSLILLACNSKTEFQMYGKVTGLEFNLPLKWHRSQGPWDRP